MVVAPSVVPLVSPRFASVAATVDVSVDVDVEVVVDAEELSPAPFRESGFWLVAVSTFSAESF